MVTRHQVITKGRTLSLRLRYINDVLKLQVDGVLTYAPQTGIKDQKLRTEMEMLASMDDESFEAVVEGASGDE